MNYNLPKSENSRQPKCRLEKEAAIREALEYFHIELNGYMENVAELTKPPFDKPVSFVKLFDAKTREAIMSTIRQVRDNAVQIAAL